MGGAHDFLEGAPVGALREERVDSLLSLPTSSWEGVWGYNPVSNDRSDFTQWEAKDDRSAFTG